MHINSHQIMDSGTNYSHKKQINEVKQIFHLKEKFMIQNIIIQIYHNVGLIDTCVNIQKCHECIAKYFLKLKVNVV